MQEYTIANNNTRISKSEAKKQKWAWPFYLPKDDPTADRSALLGFPQKIPLHDHSSALIKILDPQNSSPELRAVATKLYFHTNASCSLVPPLVDLISVTVYVFRRRCDSEAEPEPDWDDPVSVQYTIGV